MSAATAGLKGVFRRVTWPACGLVVLAALLPSAWHERPLGPAARAPVVAAVPAPAPVAQAAPAVPVPVLAASRPAAPAPVATDATAPDLRRLHDEYAGSADPRERRMAARAFNACVPLFVPSRGETPSAEALVAALPVRARAEREQALRSLYARCHGFAGERAEVIAAMDRRWREDGSAQDAGNRVLDALLDGDMPGAERLFEQALTASDPASVAALSGIAIRLAAARPEGIDRQRAEAVDAALPLVACDLGLDCSAQSLAALQLCALHAACDGDLPARLDVGSPADRAAVEVERRRLRALLERGVPLTLEELLPAQARD